MANNNTDVECKENNLCSGSCFTAHVLGGVSVSVFVFVSVCVCVCVIFKHSSLMHLPKWLLPVTAVPSDQSRLKRLRGKKLQPNDGEKYHPQHTQDRNSDTVTQCWAESERSP